MRLAVAKVRSLKQRNLIYEATFTTTSGLRANPYIGITEKKFKTRHINYKLSFNDRKHSHATGIKGKQHKLQS